MPRFRTRGDVSVTLPTSRSGLTPGSQRIADASFAPVFAIQAPVFLERVRRLAADVLRPAHFFLAARLDLLLEHRLPEEIPWEIFNGQLLDGRLTARRQAFESWNLFLIEERSRSDEPILSLKLDAAAGELHVTRALQSYVWEAYDEGNNVILSRERPGWVRELVGTIALERFPDEDDLRDEVICRLFLAVVGSSRLPLTSVQSPLPLFSLGDLLYVYRPGSAPEAAGMPLRTWQDLLSWLASADLAPLERAKLLETLLHAVSLEEMDKAVESFGTPGCPATSLLRVLRTLFNEAALSPYTDLVDKSLDFLEAMERKGQITSGERVDFVGHLLRQVGRHLTAYDLVTFHHQGANYPDALLLDAALKAYLKAAEAEPSLFIPLAGASEADEKSSRFRRRALRQGWLLRRRYEGHLVPDAPTSHGENTRTLPPPHIRVPEEQILHPHRRTRRLYDGDPLDAYLGTSSRAVLGQSIADLTHPDELRELGLALFLDRPLGAGKGPLEPDQTPLLSYLAFSRSIARRRLDYLANSLQLIPERTQYNSLCAMLEHALDVKGLPLEAISATSRPGGASLADMAKVADDFLVLRTTSQTAAELFEHYDFKEVKNRFFLNDPTDLVLIVRVPAAADSSGLVLALYDAEIRRRLEVEVDPRLGYASRGGREFPVAPLRIVRAWSREPDTESLQLHDLTAAPILLPPLP